MASHLGILAVLARAARAPVDPHGGNSEDSVQVMREEMSTRDLMRLRDSLRGGYRLSAPCLAKTVRLGPDSDPAEESPERSLVFPTRDGSRGPP